MLYRQMLPYIQLSWIEKDFIEQNRLKQYFGEIKSNSQDYKQDGSGLQFINFDFMTGGQEIKVPILVDF